MVGVLTLATASVFDLTMIGEFIAGLWFAAFIYAEQVIRFVLAWGKELFGIFGGAAGILKWWYHREAVLHKRLERYLEREDVRLKNARRDVLYTLARPSERRKFEEPKFAVGPLRTILRRRQLDGRWSWQLPESAADRALSDALKQIARRSEVLQSAQQNFREQSITAHIFKGVVAALRAQRSPVKGTTFRTEALHAFQTALAIPGQDHRLFVIEQIAHQQRCLDMHDAAAETYARLLAEIEERLTGRPRDFARARALKWRALVYQTIRWIDGTPSKGSLNAFDGAGQGLGISGAIALWGQHAPLREWDSIEYGDALYTGAFIAHNLNFTNVRDGWLADAAAAYSSADGAAKKPIWRLRGKEKMLAKAARAGIQRVQAARNGANYALEWLLPPGVRSDPIASGSDAPQNPTQAISGGGSQDGVPQAP
jgi:hypothetical protein